MPFSTADHLEEESCVFCGFVDPRARATQPGSLVEVVGEEGLLWGWALQEGGTASCPSPGKGWTPSRDPTF